MHDNTQAKIITCIQCDCDFDYTVQEQNYYEERGFDEPKRCPVCRKKKSKLLYMQPVRKKMIKKRYHQKDL